MRLLKSFAIGLLIGTLGGLIGLGGAEFRLPLLVGLFNFASLEAVIINKISSLIVVFFSIPFRSQSIAWSDVFSHVAVILNILAGSMAGAWVGAHYASKIKTRMLDKVMVVLLVCLSAGMILGHGIMAGAPLVAVFDGWILRVLGVVAGLGIGLVSSILGVAGGELIIPTLVLLFGIDVKLAGSLSLCISLPTMLVAFIRYTQSGAIRIFLKEKSFI
ncbi:MAG TPA: sulfite exporter TauE/SafE family protein, partial [Fibrobacteraceae bacterium]|nr:sulfite exporter TauE/SafE family protein [Fibrobacteraceae bacterium]